LKKVESVIGIAENESNAQFSISPNPVKDKLVVQSFNEMICKITISDLLGNKIEEYTSMQPISTINVSGLSSGVFFITIEIGEANFTQKFVKL